MSAWISAPYLPQDKVNTLIAGEGMRPYESALGALGIRILYTDSVPTLSEPIRAHADLVVFPFGNKHFLLDKSQTALYAHLQSIGAKPQFAETHVQNGYPKDIPLNCVRIGRNLLCNPKYADKAILSFAKQENCVILGCRQGYVKCSVVVVRENAIITDDVSIAKAAGQALDVLLAEKGSVRLPGFSYGFIGGCCTLISPSEMLFVGDLQNHSDKDSIKSFLRNYGIYPISLNKMHLIDVGSLIPLTTQEVSL